MKKMEKSEEPKMRYENFMQNSRNERKRVAISNLKHFHCCFYRISMETAGLPIPAYSYIAPNHIVKAPH